MTPFLSPPRLCNLEGASLSSGFSVSLSFLIWSIFEVFIELIKILFLFYVLVSWP